MFDGYFGWNATTFPLQATASLTDPVTNTILRYFQNIIQLNLGSSFAVDAVNCGFLNAQMNYIVDNNMVPQALAYPPDSLLNTTNFKFPLLSVHRLSRKFEQHSSMKLMIHSNYVINFTLPPLSPTQYNYLYKYLDYVGDVLTQRTWQGFDPQYNDGEQVWKTANIAYALLEGDEYGTFTSIDGKNQFPSIRMKMTVMEESQFVDANYGPFESVFIQTNVYDGYNLSLPVENIADGYSIPQLSLSSISVSSGTVQGGTLVSIIGTGFDNVLSSFTSTFNITFNNAPVSRLVVKTNNNIIVITGPGASVGNGNVVITDRFGNQATLTGIWNYD